jgi:hypothetical protein
VRALGEALLEVLRAELGALQGDFQRSGRHLGIALALLGGAAVLGFWAVGLVLFVLVSLFAVWLPLWGAALVVLGLFLGGIAILGWQGKKRLLQVENPVTSVRKRLDDHLAWWQESFLAPAGDDDLDLEPRPSGRTYDEDDEEEQWGV